MKTKSTTSASGSFAKLMESAQAPDESSPRQQKITSGARTIRTDGVSERSPARPAEPPERTNGRTRDTVDRTRGLLEQIPDAPKDRKPERYSFQFWDDQIVRLKRLRQVKNILSDPYERKETTMSDMVRQAIDDYLDKQTKQIQQSERTDV